MKRTTSFWHKSKTFPFQNSKELPNHVDVAIIGSGLTGCTIAMELKQQNISFALLENSNTIGLGMSSRDGAVSRLGIGDNPMRLNSSLGEDIAKKILRYTQENANWLVSNDLCLEKGGLYISTNKAEEEELQHSCKLLKKWGFPVHLYDQAKINNLLQGNSFFDGYYHSNDICFSPYEFFQRCKTLQPFLHTRCFVEQIQSNNTLQLQTSKGRLLCEIVVIANNQQARHLDPFFTDKITPVRLQSIAVPSKQKQLPAQCQYGYIQWRDNDQYRLISGCRWGTPHLEVGESDDSLLSPIIGAHLRKFAKNTFNITANPEYEWTGIMGFSCDGLPLIGALPGTSDIISCCGFSGNQASLGFAAGASVANLIVNGKAPTLPTIFHPSRFLE
jgi:glycine/D-amino acid oxidase-like deaminating enzyme